MLNSLSILQNVLFIVTENIVTAVSNIPQLYCFSFLILTCLVHIPSLQYLDSLDIALLVLFNFKACDIDIVAAFFILLMLFYAVLHFWDFLSKFIYYFAGSF